MNENHRSFSDGVLDPDLPPNRQSPKDHVAYASLLLKHSRVELDSFPPGISQLFDFIQRRGERGEQLIFLGVL